MRETRAYVNRKTREKEKKRKEGAREGGIGRRGRKVEGKREREREG